MPATNELEKPETVTVWKKKENDPTAPPSPQPVPERPAARPQAPPPRRSDRAVIGPTLRIQGQVFGEEELLIQGQVDGKVQVKGQAVTVGKSGKVRADIHARSIRVEGMVRGDLFGEQEVIIEASGDVAGNLIAPGVRLENGASFKGSIDMEQKQKPQPPAAVVKPASSGPPSSPAAGEVAKKDRSSGSPPAGPGQSKQGH